MSQMIQVLTKDQMRADIAAQIGLAPEEIEADESLVDQGLDSMQVMTLLMQWGEVIQGLDFARFMEAETLDDWWLIAEQAQSA
ncbi:phosphopantetheine-binding protein [Pseudooceanicola sediminis]|uniref:Phosphopantetheine-binding protein n=1 Tax=Pseudooceanicola sediminis TaxID=2211117 RepID=A0A399IZ44_9RHOB|nr:phosphopantetheine-binding protein [Pseudooceanicola sediminis]KAA2313705.1 phosphopantetheine-binding protein [Puniceibacterium sp. HSS470]RII38458.1 phosphopantetheine-binding protein [Pseudooceanicola sediminis]|tara:strand:+ start:118370 stop:118618 length:249 start_codon:yes stop_codon:yes gene_type:complete